MDSQNTCALPQNYDEKSIMKTKPSQLTIVMAQLNFVVGDIQNNAEKIIAASIQARDELKADMIVFPELALTSYPPEDLLFCEGLYEQVNSALKKIKEEIKNIAVIVGLPVRKQENRIYNKAICFYNGSILADYAKQQLPNYHVFDEKRYFTRAHQSCVFEFRGVYIGLLICEDLWYSGPIFAAKKMGAELIISINASPFNQKQSETRQNLLAARAHQTQLPIIYCNLIGGQDELVFDGGSMAMNAHSKLAVTSPYFKESLTPVVCKKNNENKIIIHSQPLLEPLTRLEKIYQALVLGTRDYLMKNNFKGALLGLSGGIDSALVLTIAADAVGAENVTAVIMPSRYTASISIEDALKQAKTLGVECLTLSIECAFEAFLKTLKPIWGDKKPNIIEENIQARIRGILLMALSNHTGKMVLTTSNKSESAVGYTTLYGDMCGGLSVIKDVNKNLVYELARYRNAISLSAIQQSQKAKDEGSIIPERVFTRAPSAELRENQTDQDSLPPYDILDEIIKLYVEKDESIAAMVKKGFDETTVKRIARLIHLNEYKRRQSAPCIRITERAFGKDRRYPITSRYNK